MVWEVTVLATDKSTIALVVSLVTAAIALTSLAWQFALYRLSGARLYVQLIPTILTVHGHLVNAPERGWRRLPQAFILRHAEEGYVDLALIRVTNVGRAPISVSDVALNFGHLSRPWWPHTVAGTPVGVPGGVKELAALRLEPGDTVSVYFDDLPIIESVRRQRPRLRSVRASATPAGRKPKKSPRRRRWRFSGPYKFAWPFSVVDDDQRAFLEVFRIVYPRDVNQLYRAWVGVGALRLTDPNADARALAQVLSEALDLSPTPIDVYTAAHAIQQIYRSTPDPSL